MPGFESSGSDSPRKMENGVSARLGGGGGNNKFDIGNVIGDPFSLATIGIAICGWLVAFVSAVIDVVTADASATPFPKYVWWTLVFSLLTIVGVMATVATNSISTYHVAIVGFLSACLVQNTSSVNALIYQSEAAREAGAAGFILLSMVSIVWIFYYGSQPQASHRQTLDSYALHKDRRPSRTASRHMTQSYRPDTKHSSSQQPQMHNSTTGNNSNHNNTSALAGFETSSPVAGYAGGRPGETRRDSTSGFPAPTVGQTLHSPQPASHAPSGPAHPQDHSVSVSPPTEYPYRAKAIYSYEANPDDANEISFTKHEILEVSDVSGRWWQAKKENGETGIAPSNYLILL